MITKMKTQTQTPSASLTTIPKRGQAIFSATSASGVRSVSRAEKKASPRFAGLLHAGFA